jgi:hypothetical protein
MPATARTTTTLSRTTASVLAASPGTAADATNGDAYPNGENTFLIMNNTGGSTYTVTVAYTSTVDGQAVTGRQFSVPATTMHVVKLGRPDLYGSTATITAQNTAVKLAVYSL